MEVWYCYSGRDHSFVLIPLTSIHPSIRWIQTYDPQGNGSNHCATTLPLGITSVLVVYDEYSSCYYYMFFCTAVSYKKQAMHDLLLSNMASNPTNDTVAVKSDLLSNLLLLCKFAASVCAINCVNVMDWAMCTGLQCKRVFYLSHTCVEELHRKEKNTDSVTGNASAAI